MPSKTLGTSSVEVTARFNHVLHVLLMSTWHQVIKVHAGRIMAKMADLFRNEQGANSHGVPNSVNTGVIKAKTANCQQSVSILIPSTIPFMATVGGNSPTDAGDSFVNGFVSSYGSHGRHHRPQTISALRAVTH